MKKLLAYGMMMALVLVLIGAGVNSGQAQPAPKKDTAPAPKKDAAPAPKTTPAPTPAPAPKPVANPATLDSPCKVGFVNLSRVLEESQEGKKLKSSLDAERDKTAAPLKAKQKQLDDLKSKITALTQEMIQKNSVWSDDEKLRKQNELQNLQLQYNQLLQSLSLEDDKAREGYMKRRGEILKPLEDKLNKIVEDVGSKSGFCVIFDVSPPSSNVPNFNPILYRDPAREITDQIIKAVDGK